jgi:hypothetical protein
MWLRLAAEWKKEFEPELQREKEAVRKRRGRKNGNRKVAIASQYLGGIVEILQAGLSGIFLLARRSRGASLVIQKNAG